MRSIGLTETHMECRTLKDSVPVTAAMPSLTWTSTVQEVPSAGHSPSTPVVPVMPTGAGQSPPTRLNVSVVGGVVSTSVAPIVKPILPGA